MSSSNVCFYCNSKYLTIYNLNKHMRKKISILHWRYFIDNITCCFQYLYYSIFFFWKECKSKVYTSNDCGETFNSKMKIIKHINSHNGSQLGYIKINFLIKIVIYHSKQWNYFLKHLSFEHNMNIQLVSSNFNTMESKLKKK